MTKDEFNTDEGFDAAYTDYHQTVFTKIHDVLQNFEDASDLTEEVFIIAWIKRANFDSEKGSLGLWLLQIVGEVLRQFERRKKR